jgi:hypothetical protein
MFKYILKKLKENRGDLGGLFGGSSGNQVASIPIPQFQTDPNFTNSQNSLSTLGQQVLSGNLPSFYSSLGKANSPQFQSMISNVTGQTQQAAQSQEAIAGTGRSGVGAATSALALNNVIPGLNYQDLQNAQSQQEGLLQFGGQVTQDVAGNSLNNQSQLNNFALSQFQDEYQQAAYNNQYNQNSANALGSTIGTVIGGGLGLATGGLSGLAIGAGLGSSIGGGGSTGGSSSVGSLSSLLSGLNNTNYGNTNSNYNAMLSGPSLSSGYNLTSSPFLTGA